MPTGYTAGIMDGTIKTFPEFAKICIRNFGVAMHMRDEELSKPYEQRVISPYHSGHLSAAKIELEFIKKLSDKEIISKRKGEIEDEIRRYNTYAIECGRQKGVLTGILNDVLAWIPPTTEHQGIKDFMIQQINSTIDSDADDSFYEKQKEELEFELMFLKADKTRKVYIDRIQWEVDYHTENLKKEMDRVTASNKWADLFFDSLPGKI